MLKTIYNRIRLFMLRRKEPYTLFYNILGFYPKNIQLYEQACLHRSSSIRTEKGRWINNERLEFLGDAILDAIVADVVFKTFDSKKEGFLTNTRSKIVQRETLNKLAVQIGLDKLIISSMKTNSHNNYMYGNAFEAFIGAIYLDQGYNVCKKFVEERVIAPYINLSKVAKKEFNFKSWLIEWCQKQKISIEFSLVESFVDHDNNPVFQSQAQLGGLSGGIGIGYSKKESQQNAARMALKKLHNDKTYYDAVIATRTVIKNEAGENDNTPIDELPNDATLHEEENTPALPN